MSVTKQLDVSQLTRVCLVYQMSISVTHCFLLEFNLPPIHLCDGIISDVLDMRKQHFMYNRDVSGSLVSHFSHLRDVDNGAAVRT